jgi:protein-disulfide isomerase
MRPNSAVIAGVATLFGLTAIGLVACANTPTDPAPAAASTSQPAVAASAALGATPSDTVVATWKGGSVTYGDLAEELGVQLVQIEVEYLNGKYQAESQGLDQLVVTKLLEAEAAAVGLADVDALLKIEVENKIVAPTDAELQEFYKVMQRQLRGASFEDVRERIVAEVTRRKQSERFGTYIEEVKVKHGVALNLPRPVLPRIPVSVDDDPSKGPADAKVTIVQFAEFQCPYCGKAGESVDKVMEVYGDDVRMVFRDFPLSFHDRAIPAAVAANCAGEQGKYWEMHDKMMSDQRSLADADLMAHATALQLDIAKWQTCRKDPKQAAEVMKDFEDGQAVGVSGTPAFFINGIMISGAQPFEEFKRIIDGELERG